MDEQNREKEKMLTGKMSIKLSCFFTCNIACIAGNSYFVIDCT